MTSEILTFRMTLNDPGGKGGVKAEGRSSLQLVLLADEGTGGLLTERLMESSRAAM